MLYCEKKSLVWLSEKHLNLEFTGSDYLIIRRPAVPLTLLLGHFPLWIHFTSQSIHCQISEECMNYNAFRLFVDTPSRNKLNHVIKRGDQIVMRQIFFSSIWLNIPCCIKLLQLICFSSYIQDETVFTLNMIFKIMHVNSIILYIRKPTSEPQSRSWGNCILFHLGPI